MGNLHSRPLRIIIRLLGPSFAVGSGGGNFSDKNNNPNQNNNRRKDPASQTPPAAAAAAAAANSKRWAFRSYRVPQRIVVFFITLAVCMTLLQRDILYTTTTNKNKKEVQSSHDNLQLHLHSPTMLEECTVEASKWPRPNNLNKLKYQDVLQSEQVLSFLISSLDKIGAPVTLMYGTMLREFRNGTKTGCLRPDYQDKDFDIAVFPKHFHFIYGILDDLKQKFNTTYIVDIRERMFLSIGMHNKLFNIDVYGFECKKEEGLIHFPWDMIAISTNSFFPVRRHKRVLLLEEQLAQAPSIDTTTNSNENNTSTTHTGGYEEDSTLAFHMPNDPPCLLENIYGADYMTPRTGKTVQAKYGTHHGRLAHGNPVCDLPLNTYYQQQNT